ncbi:Vms1/Ankzf1 family peptidyl-tRNA hydrolase [Chloroflexota bacterium]
MTFVLRKFFLRRSKMIEFINEIEGLADPSAISVYMPPGFSTQETRDLMQKAVVQVIPDEFGQLASSAKNGAVLFWGDVRKCLILPPFPLSEKTNFNGYVVEPLRLLLISDFTIGLVLVHLGSYAVGISHGEKLISSKVGTGLVHGRHRKGGSSQQRFQRRRENQIRDFLDRLCLHAREHIEPHSQLIDYIAYGGPRQTILLLQKRCSFLQSFEDRVLPFFDVPSLRQRVLETAVGRIWSSCIIDWRDEYDAKLT